MRILHIVDTINELAGGTTVHICRMADATAELGAGAVEIMAIDLPELGKVCPTSPKVTVRLFPRKTPYLYGRGREFNDAIREAAADPNAVFHIHRMWRLPQVAASKYARRNGRPCILSPHGTLNPFSLSLKSLRKKIMWQLVESKRVGRADVLRATSMMEAESMAELVPNVPIAVIPPGAELPELPVKRSPREFRTALFLSRIMPYKGLLNLIEAWSIIRPRGWKLVIAGPDEGGYRARVAKAVEQCGLADQVSFAGPVFGEKKWEQYLNADLFILPTMSENFGIAVAEALACALPVITTRGAPWEELKTHACGWWIETGIDPLVAAMREAFQMERSELKAMGQRGRDLIEGKYTWPKIARQILELYRWAGNNGPRPSFII